MEDENKSDNNDNNNNNNNARLRIKDAEYDRLLKQEEKKKKTLRDRIFLALKRKRVKTNKISAVQSIINQVIKEKANTPDQIAAIMQKRGMEKSNEVINIASLVMDTKVINDKIVLSDRISEKPLFTYYTTYVPELSALTNDVLYLWYIYYTDIQEEVNENDEAKEFKIYMLNKCALENVGIVSAPMVLGGEIKKGYYQDYSGQYLALNLDNINEENRNKILNLKAGASEFIYLDTKYYVSGNREACVIYTEENKGKIKEMYDNMKILKAENNKIELNEKVLPIKRRPKFLSCKLKGERFCPCYMVFPSKINIACLYKIKLDNNAVFEELEKNMKKNVFKYPRNICYWNELDSFVDFMWVFALASRTISPDFKKGLMDILVLYEKNKPAFQMWKTVQLEYQRLLYEYYNSFNTRIKYDKLMNIFNKMNEHIKIRASLMRDNSYKDVINFFKYFGDMAEYINRQFTDKCQIAADKVVDALSKLDNGKIKGIDEIKETGILIYFLSDTPDYDKYMYPSFPFILSPGAFLGNIIDKGTDDVGEDFIDEMIENHNKNKERMNMNNEDAVKNINNLIDNVDDSIKEVLINNIKKYYKKYGIKKEDSKNIEKAVIDNAFKDEDLIKRIKNDIILKTISSGSIKEIDLKNDEAFTDIVDNIVNDFNLQEKKEKLEKNIELIKMEKNINNIKNEMNQIKNKDINVLKANLSKRNVTGIPPKKRKGKDSLSYISGTVVGQSNFTDYDNLEGVIAELETMNNDEEGIFKDDNLITINREKVPSRVLDYLKLCYLIAVSNSGKGKPEMVERKKTLGELVNTYKLDKKDMGQLSGKNYSLKKEINSLHKDPKHKVTYPYIADKKLSLAIAKNTKSPIAEVEQEEEEKSRVSEKEKEENEEEEEESEGETKQKKEKNN